MNTRRMNRLEELGRVDAEKAFTKKGARNLREEKKRIVGELKKADGGKVKKKKSRKNPMKDDRAREGLKSKYRKMGFGKLIDDGTIDFSEYKSGGKVRGKPKAPRDQAQQRRAQGSRKKEISADNKKRIAVMDAAKETVTGGGMRADRFKEGLNIKGSKDSAMKYYARGDTDHGKLAQKNYEKMKNNTYAKGGKALKPVKPSQKGLKKLPTKVRNKMGYMKKGGRVGMGKALRGGGCVR